MSKKGSCINRIKLYEKSTYISIIVAFVAFMLIATFLDLEINKALARPSSFYANFFGKIGELPYFCSILIGSTILYQSVNWHNKAKKIIYLLMILIGAFVLWSHIADNLFSKGIPFYYAYIIYFSLITAFLAIVSTNHIRQDVVYKLVYFAIFILLLALISRLATGLIKEIWVRLRFSYMNPETYDGFTPWYKPNFTTDNRLQYVFGEYTSSAFRSFISGHTASAGVSYSLIILPDIFVNLYKYRKWFYIAPTIYVIIVASSRIIMGVHFLSDVSVAFMMSFTIASLLRWLYFKNKFFLKSRQFVLVT